MRNQFADALARFSGALPPIHQRAVVTAAAAIRAGAGDTFVNAQTLRCMAAIAPAGGYGSRAALDAFTALAAGTPSTSVDLSGSDFSGVTLTEGIDDSVDPGATLAGSRFDGAQLIDLYIGAVLTGTSWRGARCQQSGFTLATNLNPGQGADLTGADFRGCGVPYDARNPGGGYRLQLYFANLTGTNFQGAHLAGSNLGGANLTGANFRSADLRGAFSDEVTPCAVTLATDFTNARLESATFLYNAVLPVGFRINGATFDALTAFPPGFDPFAAGGRLVPMAVA